MRIVAISDVHGLYENVHIPDGDVLVVAGDLTGYGTLDELYSFNNWIGKFNHPTKLVIAGNHNKEFETQAVIARKILSNALYLEDNGIIIEGIKFYGSPWTPNYYNWAFMLPARSKELTDKWSKIPDDVNVLITHGPPQGILDKAYDESKTGDPTLRRRVEELKYLKAHIFGHIHEGYGQQPPFYNVAICNIRYEPVNPATIIDL